MTLVKMDVKSPCLVCDLPAIDYHLQTKRGIICMDCVRIIAAAGEPTVKQVETELAYLNFRKEHYIPKSKIEQRICELEVEEFNAGDRSKEIKELKALLGEDKEK